jgi:hypothetical protein
MNVCGRGSSVALIAEVKLRAGIAAPTNAIRNARAASILIAVVDDVILLRDRNALHVRTHLERERERLLKCGAVGNVTNESVLLSQSKSL